MTAAHKLSTRFAATIDAETSVIYQRAERALVSSNPALEGEITPTMMLRLGLRAIVTLYGGGGAGASPPTPASSPSSPALSPSPVEAPPPVAAPMQEQPPPARVEPPVQPAPAADKPRSTRVDRTAKATKAGVVAKPAARSTRGKAPATPTPDQRQMEIPGADGTASTGSKEPAPVGKGRRSWASREDVEKIATYLSTPGAIGALALSKRADVPGAKSSLFAIQKAKREGQPLPGLSKSNAAAIIACINELPRAQSDAAVARGSQGEETPRQG